MSKRPPLPGFFRWVGLGFVAPVVMGVVSLAFGRSTPAIGATPWPAHAVAALLWIQLVHALAGVVIFRDKRWVIFWLGFVSVLATAALALDCFMNVTGIWL